MSLKLVVGDRRVLGALVVFRVVNCLLTQTYFVPDEHWQSVEPAHQLVFGVGHLTWEYRPEHALRSYLHPLLFAAVYALLNVLGL